ncbi:MAG: hypothetical protein RR253_02940, partial [Oscillospiraceae bacterium]
ALVIIIVLGIIAYNSYVPANFTISKCRVRSTDNYVEHFGMGWSPIMKEPDIFNKRVDEIHKWNEECFTDIYENYIAPKEVFIYATIDNGKTILKYQGTVTTKDGQSIEYLKEKTFNFVLDKKLEDFQN